MPGLDKHKSEDLELGEGLSMSMNLAESELSEESISVREAIKLKIIFTVPLPPNALLQHVLILHHVFLHHVLLLVPVMLHATKQGGCFKSFTQY